MRPRRTKIVATLGPSTDAPGVIERMLDAGMNCVRINCSYGDSEIWRSRVERVRAAATERGLAVPVIFDLQGPKIRLVSSTAETHLSTGIEVSIAGESPEQRSDEGALLEVDSEDFLQLVRDGSEIVIGDGTPRLRVRTVASDRVVATVEAPGRIGPGKGVTVLEALRDNEAVTQKDNDDLQCAAELNAEFVAASFVHSADDVVAIVQRLRAAGSNARVIAKIEQIEAYRQLDGILEVADGVMVARGDLGVAIGIERVPLVQKDTIQRSTQAGKVVITATQMLESMISSPEPTRAEVADVANAVIDGTSAVMLSAETSTGAYPVEAVEKMAVIAYVTEEGEVRGATGDTAEERRDAAVMHAALYLSLTVDATAIVVPTTSGGTARTCAKYRPKRRIIALAEDAFVASQLNLDWGVEAAPLRPIGADDDLMQGLLTQAGEFPGFESGDVVVVTVGPRRGQSGATNLIAVREIP